MHARTLPAVCLFAGLVLTGCTTGTRYDSSAAVTPRFAAEQPADPVPAITLDDPKPAETARPAVVRTPPTTQADSPAIDRVVTDIKNASTLDRAMDAYSAGLAADRNSIALQNAYVRRMVDFDAPQLAVAAAKRLVDAEPSNGLARAVVADAEARQGSMVDALTNISLAARRAGSDPFVQKTTANLIAWYDNNPRPPRLPGSVRESLQQLHSDLETKPTFAEAYKEANKYFVDERERAAKSATSAPATQPVAGNQPLLPPEALADRPDYAGYTGTDIGYIAAPQPYTVYHEYYYGEPYGWYYPFTYYGSPFYSGFGFYGFYGGGYGYHHHWHDLDCGFRERYFGHHHDGFASGRSRDLGVGTSATGFYDDRTSAGRFSNGNFSANSGVYYGGSNYSRGYSGGSYGRQGYSQGYVTPRFGGSRNMGRSSPFSSRGGSFGGSAPIQRGGFASHGGSNGHR
jgi:hypothetical protein